jgi:hypothetical protein
MEDFKLDQCQVCKKKIDQEILYDCDKCHALVCEKCSTAYFWKDGSMEINCKSCNDKREA